jgi:beta-lactamase regulating signal transducer with metallopeptidase domain
VTPFFWILLGLGLFALVLALQMRMIVSVALRRALAAKFGGLPTDTAWRLTVVEAAAPAPASEAALHLANTYPAPRTCASPGAPASLHRSSSCLSLQRGG